MEAYFGDLASFRVFGSLKVAEVLVFRAFLPLVPLTTAFLAALALAVENYNESVIPTTSMHSCEK